MKEGRRSGRESSRVRRMRRQGFEGLGRTGRGGLPLATSRWGVCPAEERAYLACDLDQDSDVSCRFLRQPREGNARETHLLRAPQVPALQVRLSGAGMATSSCIAVDSCGPRSVQSMCCEWSYAAWQTSSRVLGTRTVRDLGRWSRSKTRTKSPLHSTLPRAR